MTPDLLRRGYDDYTKGAVDEALMSADTADGRAYRDGTRMARRDIYDSELAGFDSKAPDRASEVTLIESKLAPQFFEKLDTARKEAAQVMGIPEAILRSDTPGAFSDAVIRKRRAQKPADPAQSSFL